MLGSVLRLQSYIKPWVALSTTENNYSELLMSQEEWTHIQESTIFLKPLSDYTYAVSTGQDATIHNAFFIYNDIFDFIEKQWKRICKLPPNNTCVAGFLSGTRVCRLVLQKCYSKMEKKSLIYNLATIHDPSKKLSLYADWGNLTVEDPTMTERGNKTTDTIPYSEYYKYVRDL